MTRFEVVDVVRLKSGGPEVTVVDVWDEQVEHFDAMAECWWSVSGMEEMRSRAFPTACLVAVELGGEADG